MVLELDLWKWSEINIGLIPTLRSLHKLCSIPPPLFTSDCWSWKCNIILHERNTVNLCKLRNQTFLIHVISVFTVTFGTWKNIFTWHFLWMLFFVILQGVLFFKLYFDCLPTWRIISGKPNKFIVSPRRQHRFRKVVHNPTYLIWKFNCVLPLRIGGNVHNHYPVFFKSTISYSPPLAYFLQIKSWMLQPIITFCRVRKQVSATQVSRLFAIERHVIRKIKKAHSYILYGYEPP